MKRIMKIYKKVIVIFVLCVTMGIISFFTDRNVMTTYAYTEEEKAAAKAWLSQNGYAPTMDGAQQAYQDYLNGKFGPVDGGETPGGSAPQTPDDPNNETGETAPSGSQKGDSAGESKAEEKENGSGSEAKEGTQKDGSGSEAKEDTQKDGSGSEAKEGTQKDGSGSEAKEGTQKDGSGSEAKEGTQKDGSGSRTKKEEKDGGSDSKTKAASQKEKSDEEAKAGKAGLETKPAEKDQSGNKSTLTESDGLYASGDGKTGNTEGSNIGTGDGNSEDSAINNEIAAGDLNTVKHSKINLILIISVIGVIVLIYFIRHFYIGNNGEKRQEQ